jgi:glycosyltransferase involved in cell wall biosynthesis
MARILVYSTQLLNTGGIESHIFEFCRVMSHANHKIDLIVPKCKLEAEKKNILKSYCTKLFFSNVSSLAGLTFFLLLKSILLFSKKYDTLYTNGQGKTILWCSKLFKYHKWIHHHHTSGDSSDQALWPKAYNTALKNCSHLVVCSDIILNRLSSILNRKIISIPVFSRDLEGSSKLKVFRQVQLGYFGRLIPEKGIDLLIRMSCDPCCQHITFNIWGTGSKELLYSFRNFPMLKYHGCFFDKDQLKKITAELDGFLLLSNHHEGLPVSLLEVMSAGLPWLATDKGGVQDLFVSETATRIIPADLDYIAIRKCVLNFAQDCKSGIINEQDLILNYKKKYSFEIVMRQWESLLTNKYITLF